MSQTTVYILHDLHWRVLYVGVSERTVTRMGEHQRSKPWWGQVAGSTLSHYGSRQEAEAAERTLIATLRPPHNVAGQPVSPTLSWSPPPAPRSPLPDYPVLAHPLGPWLPLSEPCSPFEDCQVHEDGECPISLGDDLDPISLGPISLGHEPVLGSGSAPPMIRRLIDRATK